MSGLLPAAVFGLEVPAGDVMVPALPDFPASFRITMAAIDPSAEPEYAGTATDDAPIRATLKLVREAIGSDYDSASDDSDEEDGLEAMLNGADSEDDESDEEEKNGGPSDPAKSKKARKEAAIEQLKEALAENGSDDAMDGATDGVNGAITKLNKGKGKALAAEEDSDSEESEDPEIEEFVICTLDPAKNYQQTLDITVGEEERVYFKVSGTHTIYLTGNYLLPVDQMARGPFYNEDEDEDVDYDLSPDEDELDEESDDLDALAEPRFMEIISDDEAPKLVKNAKEAKKGKNKRAAVDSDDEPAGLDDMMAKSLKPDLAAANAGAKLSKKQLKKLKNNAGVAVAAAAENKNVKQTDSVSTDSPNSKKVQFAKNLEQGPSGAQADKATDKAKATIGVKVVSGVKIDDKKLGSGPAAKKGNKVGMRYIGKLADGKVFDSNKKGKPFTFTLGAGNVIKGWDIGIAGMSIGGERRIIIPASLAYGSKSQPGIPGNSTLTFDVKLIELN